MLVGLKMKQDNITFPFEDDEIVAAKKCYLSRFSKATRSLCSSIP
jgi:hypothetical protein